MIRTHTTRNSHRTSFLRAATMGFLMMGIAVLSAVNEQLLFAQSADGGTLLDRPPSLPHLLVQGTLHVAASPIEEPENPMTFLFLLGVLFILGGFCFHGLYITRNNEKHLRASRSI